MRILIILFLFLFSLTPAFSMPGYVEGMNDNVEPYKTSLLIQAKAEELEKAFFEKYNNGFTGEQYDSEVTIPLYEYMGKLQDAGYPGFATYYIK